MVHKGSWGLPDFGITEAAQKLFAPAKPMTSQGGSNLFGKAPASSGQVAGASTTTPYNYTPGPTSSGGGGGGGGSSAAASKGGGGSTPSAPSFDPDAEARARADRERADNDRRVSEERSAIAGEFDPIFSELDRQLGELPGQRIELEGKIGSLADTQRAGVAAGESRGIQELDKSAEGEKAQAKSSLRNLENDVRNLLQAKQFYFGAMGAGDSSATGMASEAISKGALRSRGNVLAARDAGLADIETKKQDVRNISTEQNRKIDEWKGEKLFALAEKFQEKANELNMAKANATGAKAKAINDVIRGLIQDLKSELRRLDDQSYNFKSAVANWQMQREAEMDDYMTKLSLSSKYSSAAGPKYSDALNTFNKIYGTGALTLGDARQAAASQYGIDPLSGLELTEEAMGTKKKSLSDLLGDQALAEVFASQ